MLLALRESTNLFWSHSVNASNILFLNFQLFFGSVLFVPLPPPPPQLRPPETPVPYFYMVAYYLIARAL